MAKRQWLRPPAGCEAYSVGQLHDWECLFRGHQKRVLKRKEAVSPALHEGRILHDAQAVYVTRCVNARVATDLSAVPEIVREVFFDPDAEQPHSLPVERVADITATLRQWAENSPIDWAHTVAVEEMWLPQIPGMRPATFFYVIIDHLMIDGDLAVIRDLKSDRHLRTLAEVSHDLQLASYAWGVAQHFPQIRRFRVEMDFARHGITRAPEYGMEIVEQAQEIIVAGIERIRGYRQRNTFPAIAGDGCQWCGYQTICPLITKQTDPTTIQTAEEAALAAAALHALDARRSKLRPLLSRWTSEAGPVKVGSVAYGHHLKQGVVIDDVSGAVDRLEALGMAEQAWDALRFDAGKLGRLLRGDRSGPALADLVVDASRTEFDSRKVAAEGEDSA